MALPRVSNAYPQTFRPGIDSGQQGFALLSLIALLPLLFTLLLSIGFFFYVVQRKSLAQAICIQQATRLQSDLRATLQKLLAMNPRAESLRLRRTQADQSVADALTTAYPPVIAAAEAVQSEVIVEQLEFHAEQEALLMQAERQRRESQRNLHQRVNEAVVAYDIRSPTYYFRALAVREEPAESPSPNYKPIELFTEGQQQRYSYSVDLAEGFPLPVMSIRQKTECSVSLENQEDEWPIRILAVKSS
jgi:hypothetical protein